MALPLIGFKEKECKRCGKVFKPNSSSQKYCGSRKIHNTCAYIIRYWNSRRNHYNITGEYLGKLYKKQSGLCAICDSTISHKFHIDHNHDTNKVRGLLCVKCNIGLSYVEKWVAREHWIDRALKYLSIYKTKN